MPTNRTQCLMQLWSPAHLKECYEHTHLTQGETKIQIYPQFSIWFLTCHTTWDSQGFWFPRKQNKASEQLHPVAHSQLFSSATHHTDAALVSETDRETQYRKDKSGFSNKHQIYGWLPRSFTTHVFPSCKSRGLFTTSSGVCWGRSPSARFDSPVCWWKSQEQKAGGSSTPIPINNAALILYQCSGVCMSCQNS